MRVKILSLTFLASLAGTVYAAEVKRPVQQTVVPSAIYYSSPTSGVLPYQDSQHFAVVDANGNLWVTQSTATPGIFTMSESSRTFTYVSSATLIPCDIGLGTNTKGKSYSVSVIGGTVTYKINYGATILLNNGDSDSEEFWPYLASSPTISVAGIASGATFYIKITGGNQ